jgi:acetyltransferase-like isoleucine patch superfamily enzyme
VNIQNLDPNFVKNLYKVQLRKTTISNNGFNNKIQANHAIMINCTINIVGNNCEIRIQEDTLIENASFLLNGDNQIIEIGSSCRFRNTSFWLEDGNNLVSIGDHTTIEGAHIAATEIGGKITIGKDCMLSYDIDIRNGDSHPILTVEGKQRINYPADVIIGDKVWIGAHSSILKGVTIGSHCIIGTNTLVTSDFHNNQLIVGIPAKVIREGVCWERNRLGWQLNNY